MSRYFFLFLKSFSGRPDTQWIVPSAHELTLRVMKCPAGHDGGIWLPRLRARPLPGGHRYSHVPKRRNDRTHARDRGHYGNRHSPLLKPKPELRFEEETLTGAAWLPSLVPWKDDPMGETAARFLPWPGGGGHGGTIRNRSFTILHAKRPLRMEEEEQANIGDLPLGAKRSHEPSDDDGAPLVSFLA